MALETFWGRPGVWVAAVGAAFMLLNAVRAWFAPIAFARYFGTPLVDQRDQAFVRVYGLRALFIALALTALLVRRDPIALGWIALASVVMPAGDAVLAFRAGARRSTVVRHLVIGAVLLGAAISLLI